MEVRHEAKAGPGRFGDWLIGIYAWIFALAFGATLIDSVYARSLAGSASVAAVEGAFNEAADFLQLPFVLAVLAGIAALFVSARSVLARSLVIASLAFALAPLPVIVFFGDALAASGAGSGLRLAFGAGGSLLAMAAAVVFLGRTRAG